MRVSKAARYKKHSGILLHIQFRGRVFALSIGHETVFFGQIPFIMLIEEWYDTRFNVVNAAVLWEFPKYKPKV